MLSASHRLSAWVVLARLLVSLSCLLLAAGLSPTRPSIAQAPVDCNVFTWGSNSAGQLGDGREIERSLPAPVPGLSGITAISAGDQFNIAVAADGSLRAWGRNIKGQLGDGTIENRAAPVLVTGISGVNQVAGGSNHVLALKTDGTLWAWGEDAYGQLGDGVDHYDQDNPSYKTYPVQVSGLSHVVAIDAQGTHSLAVDQNGTVWSWGSLQYGDSGPYPVAPQPVAGVDHAISAASGLYHSLVLRQDGTVWAWGYNPFGELGDGSTTKWDTPVQVTGLSGIIAVSAGAYYSLALKSDGTVWAWGHNEMGDLGDGTATNRSLPVQVQNLSDVTAISASEWGGNLALKRDGTVWYWGHNNQDIHREGNLRPLVPVQVMGLDHITAVRSAASHQLAQKADGSLWVWGTNSFGQFGVGGTLRRLLPEHLTGFSGVTSIESFASQTMAVKADGTLWAWGDNGYGSLGDGTTQSRSVPQLVHAVSAITAVEGNYNRVIALNTSGNLWSWGGGYVGGNYYTPKIDTVITNVKAIANGFEHFLVLKTDGTVWGKGYNDEGELGDGTTYTTGNWTRAVGLDNVVAIAAAWHQSLALKADGTVWEWGSSSSGSSFKVPTQVSGLSGIQAISMSWYFTMALKNDGTVWGWGSNDLLLGRTDRSYSLTPVQIPGLSHIVAIQSGEYHALAQKDDGSIWAWGYNTEGQLGDGSTTDRAQPVMILPWSCPNGISAGTSESAALVPANQPPFAESQELSVEWNLSQALHLRGWSSESLPLTYQLFNAPAHGTLSGTLPNVTYTPNQGYQGADQLTYRVSDGIQQSNLATIKLTMQYVNHAPVLTLPAEVAFPTAKTVYIGQTLRFTASASDPNHEHLTYSLPGGNYDGMTIDSQTGEFTWTPTRPVNLQFRIRVTDDGTPNLYDEQPVNVNVQYETNSPPVLNLPHLYPVIVNTHFSLNIAASDNSFDRLTYALVGDSPAGLAIDRYSGQLTWFPQTVGDYPITISVTDQGTPPLSDTQTMTISVVDALQIWLPAILKQ